MKQQQKLTRSNKILYPQYEQYTTADKTKQAPKNIKKKSHTKKHKTLSNTGEKKKEHCYDNSTLVALSLFIITKKMMSFKAYRNHTPKKIALVFVFFFLLSYL